MNEKVRIGMGKSQYFCVRRAAPKTIRESVRRDENWPRAAADDQW